MHMCKKSRIELTGREAAPSFARASLDVYPWMKPPAQSGKVA
jgi:hypothetical protein